MSLVAVEGVALTLPKIKVISSTKWELNMTRKYHVASWAMVPRIVGPLIFDVPDFAAKKVINENARKSVYITPMVSRDGRHYSCKFRAILTHRIRPGYLYVQFVGFFAV